MKKSQRNAANDVDADTFAHIATLDAVNMGHLLAGFGINLVVRSIDKTARFMRDVLQFRVLRQHTDYAVLVHRGQLYQLHTDSTYSAHPLPALLAEAGPRGGGIELRLYQVDPDQAEARARSHGGEILQPSADKPHGLRECFLLDPDGYCWVPSSKIPRT